MKTAFALGVLLTSLVPGLAREPQSADVAIPAPCDNRIVHEPVLVYELAGSTLVAQIDKTLDEASSTLRAQASAFGSNLSIVQIRQDFSKNLINVLQTGSSNLTLADTNEEAANSQALSTRQSIAVSALALANQSQQSVLQLLR